MLFASDDNICLYLEVNLHQYLQPKYVFMHAFNVPKGRVTPTHTGQSNAPYTIPLLNMLNWIPDDLFGHIVC